MYVKLLKEKQMKKGLKIAAIVVGVIIILMLLLPFAFQKCQPQEDPSRFTH